MQKLNYVNGTVIGSYYRSEQHEQPSYRTGWRSTARLRVASMSMSS